MAGQREAGNGRGSRATGMSVSAVTRKYGVHSNQLFTWRRLMHEGALSAVGAEESVVPLFEVKVLKTRVRELERLLGKKTMEVEVLKEALEIARETRLIVPMPSWKKDGTP